MKKEEVSFKTKIIWLVIILSILLILNLLFSRVQGSFEVECNSGDIDMNYSRLLLNQTDFRTELIEINGIDGLRCKINAEMDAPWWVYLRFG